jgi:hypothetical protein
MDPIVALFAQLAALLSGAGDIDPPSGPRQVEVISQSSSGQLVPWSRAGEPLSAGHGWVPVADGLRVPVQNQVRIERSITIRISPRLPRQPDLSELRNELPPHLVERRVGKCVPLRGARVEVSRNNQLLLFLRDRRIITLGLEKGCRARDFYSGFYIEEPNDGQICVDRDRLQSRTGANCALTRMRQLIEE